MSISVTGRPTVLGNTVVAGVAWANPENAGASDGAWASAENTEPLDPDNTKGLTGQGYGFAIPADAVNIQLSLGVERHGSAGSAVVDLSIYLLDAAGTPAGTNRAALGNWPETDAIATHAGDSDDWGVTLTPTLLNDANFGVVIRATLEALDIGYLDDIPLTVTYDVSIVGHGCIY